MMKPTKTVNSIIKLQALLMLLLCTSQVQSADAPFVEMGTGYDFLNNNFEDWRSHYLSVTLPTETSGTWQLESRHFDRFDIDDQEYRLAWYYKVSDKLSLHTELGWSPSPVIRPKSQQQMNATLTLSDGWVVTGGARHTNWPDSISNALSFNVEKYWGNYRIALLNSIDYLSGAGSATNSGVAFSYYYDDRSQFNVVLAGGQELEKIGELRVLRTDVITLAFWGLHYFDPDWAFRWAITLSNQDDIYQRRGVEIGVRYHF